MSSGSKFRHIFGEDPKPSESYLNVQTPLINGESSILSSNTQYLAVPCTKGQGKVYIRQLSNFGKFTNKDYYAAFSKQKILDVDFNPFLDTMVACSSDDTKTYILNFEQGGLTQNVDTATVVLEGHSKKTILNKFNPCASNILATASLDRTIKVWNIEKSSNLYTFSAFTDNIYSMNWNDNGSLIIGTSKDKNIRIFDPRQCDTPVVTTPVFEGIKSSKSFFMDRFGFFGAIGFNKNGKRELRIWDTKKADTPLKNYTFEEGSGMTFPHFDNDCNVLYCCQRGTGVIQYVEIVNDKRIVYNIGSTKSIHPLKGFSFVPKRGLDVYKCEIQRCLKLTSKDIKPISFIVPRKAGKDVFQDDLYPNAPSGVPSIESNEWEEGGNKEVNKMSLDPKNRDDINTENNKKSTFVKKASYQELEEKIVVLENRIKELEDKYEPKDQQTTQEDTQEETTQEETTENNEEEKDQE